MKIKVSYTFAGMIAAKITKSTQKNVYEKKIYLDIKMSDADEQILNYFT